MEAVFLKLVNMSLTAGWLVLAVLLLRLLLKDAPKYIRVILWGLVAARLMLPFSFESNFSLVPSAEPLPEEFLYAATPQVNTGIPALNEAINPIVSQSLAPATELTSANPTQIWSFIFSQIWILGMVLMVGYALASYLLVRRRVAASIKAGYNLRICDHIESPFILGIIRPVIYLPSDMDQQTAGLVLAHEHAHLKRKDHWWKPLGFALLCVYWFNPMIWLAYVLLCRDIELACDEKVIAELGAEEKKAYSSALLDCSMQRRMIAACPLAFGEVGVKDRIKSVLNYKKPAFWLIVIAVILCIVVAVCFLTDPIVKIDPLALENWGITVTAQDPTPLGVTLAYDIPDNLDGQITIPSNQTLLQLENGEWVDVPPIVEEKDVIWDFIKFIYPDDKAEYQRVEWERFYGRLEPGEYRIEKTLWLHKDGLGYQKEYYVEFTVPSIDNLPADTYESDAWLFQCLGVLEQIQSLDSYHIRAEWAFDGDRILNDSSLLDYRKSGDTFLRIGYIPDDNSTTAELQSGNSFYSSVSYDGSIHWEESDAFDLTVMAPWFYTFEWDFRTVAVSSRKEDSDGYSIGIRINSPYRERDDSDEAEFYDVEFYFDTQDHFQYAVLTEETDCARREGTFRVISTSAEEIAGTIESYTASLITTSSVDTLIASLLDNPSMNFLLFQNNEFHPAGNPWNARNSIPYSNSLQDFTFEEISYQDANLTGAQIRMQFVENEGIPEIRFYEGSSDVTLQLNNAVTCYRATYQYEDYPIGNVIRSWYDEAQLAQLRSETNLVQDSKLDYLTAAAKFCSDYYGIHCSVATGSMYRYSYITCEVEADEEATRLARERGELDEYCHAFRVKVIFLPENERALQEAMPGNTNEYTGTGSSIPDGSFFFTRCGYVRLTENGWIGEIVGTGW